MSKDYSKLSRVKQQLIKQPNLTADLIMKHLDVTKVYAYNLLSTARKSLGMRKQPDGKWALKTRMQSNLPKGMTVAEADAIVADVNQAIIATHYPTEDNVNHPAHYKVGGVETIDFIEAKNLSYHLGNVVKYISRADHKGSRLENLKKAQWYLEREIANASK
jgi:hypothetical protein